jgi:hypothetical protein
MLRKKQKAGIAMWNQRLRGKKSLKEEFDRLDIASESRSLPEREKSRMRDLSKSLNEI